MNIFEKRLNNLHEWICKNASFCFVEQKHLDEGSTERAYWHFGYMAALADVLRQDDEKKVLH